MKRAFGILIAVAAVTAAAWWLFWLTPSRGGQRDDMIRFGFWGGDQEYQMWREVAERFERDHPGVKIRLEYVPRDYSRKLQAWLASDTAPEVMLLQDEPFPRYMARSGGDAPVLVDLTEMIAGIEYGPDLAVDRKGYYATAWDSFGRSEPDGKRRQYGLPVFGGNNLIFYNRECFRRAGVPLPEDSGIDGTWTCEGFLDLCKRLTVRREIDGKTRVIQWGFARPFGWLYWLPFIYACDAEILSDDRSKFIFNGPGALASLKLWDDLARHDATPTGWELGSMRQNVAFLTGKVAMVCQGPWAMPFFNEAKIDYGVIFPPKSPTGAQGTRVTWDCVGLAGRLRNDPERLRVAYQFARFVASPAAAQIFARAQRSIPAHRGGTAAFVAGSAPTRSARFVEAMEFSRVQPITPKWEEMDEALLYSLGRLTRKALTPAEALADMEREITGRGLFPSRRPDGTLVPAKEGR